MFERARVIAREIVEGGLSAELVRETERILSHAVLGLHARCEQLEESEAMIGPSFCSQPSTTPEQENPGQTHFPGCWRDRGHHNCAVALLERFLHNAGKAS